METKVVSYHLNEVMVTLEMLVCYRVATEDLIQHPLTVAVP